MQQCPPPQGPPGPLPPHHHLLYRDRAMDIYLSFFLPSFYVLLFLLQQSLYTCTVKSILSSPSLCLFSSLLQFFLLSVSPLTLSSYSHLFSSMPFPLLFLLLSESLLISLSLHLLSGSHSLLFFSTQTLWKKTCHHVIQLSAKREGEHSLQKRVKK